MESAWEIVENSSWIIARFREQTASEEYTGDTVANSVGDLLGYALGVVLAHHLGPTWGAATFLGVELTLLAWVRDSLIVHVLMLVYPIEAIQRWQRG